jgi:hypothetical protein
VHADDVDLTGGAGGVEGGTLLRVDLGPVERGDVVGPVVGRDQDQSRRVEPRLRHPLLQVGEGQPTLLGVVGERGGIRREPGLLVVADLERARAEPLRQGHRGPLLVVGAQRPGHLVQLAAHLQAG